MSLESDQYTYLTGVAGLVALISTRLYPQSIPQEPTLPAISYFRVDTPAIYVHNQATAIAETPRFQYDCWATSHANMIAVADALKAELLAWKAAGGRTVRIRNQYDLPEPEIGRWRRVVDAEFLDI